MNPAVSQLILLLFVGVFGYFVLIRPQRAQRQRQKDLVDALQAGDRIITIGGFYGTVRSIDGDDIHLELGRGTEATIVKAAVARKVVDLDAQPAAGGASAAGK